MSTWNLLASIAFALGVFHHPTSASIISCSNSSNYINCSNSSNSCNSSNINCSNSSNSCDSSNINCRNSSASPSNGSDVGDSWEVFSVPT